MIIDSNYEKRGNFLVRQEIKNLTIEQTPINSLICNLSSGIILILIAIPLITSSNNYKEYRSEYTNCSYYKNIGNNSNYNCEVIFNVEEDIEGPLYLFYNIEEFYINHKEFVRSKIFSNLRNANDQDTEFLKCEGAQYMYQVKDNKLYETYAGYPLKENSIANPCGLFAKYRFSDKFKLINNTNDINKEIEISYNNITYKEHRDTLFKNADNSKLIQYIDVEDESFIVWMSDETDHNFIKPLGKINLKLFKKGKYSIYIKNSWDVGKNKTRKYITLTTGATVGSDNIFQKLLIIMGSFCILYSFFMLYTYFAKKNETFKISKMRWK